MILWRDILKSLELVDNDRLDDRAVILVGAELLEFDLLELEIDEIGDARIIGVLTNEND